MGVQQKLKQEIVTLLSVTLFFSCWLAVMMLLKWLILADYEIAFQGFPMVLIGALVLAKLCWCWNMFRWLPESVPGRHGWMLFCARRCTSLALCVY